MINDKIMIKNDIIQGMINDMTKIMIEWYMAHIELLGYLSYTPAAVIRTASWAESKVGWSKYGTKARVSRNTIPDRHPL